MTVITWREFPTQQSFIYEHINGNQRVQIDVKTHYKDPLKKLVAIDYFHKNTAEFFKVYEKLIYKGIKIQSDHDGLFLDPDGSVQLERYKEYITSNKDGCYIYLSWMDLGPLELGDSLLKIRRIFNVICDRDSSVNAISFVKDIRKVRLAAILVKQGISCEDSLLGTIPIEILGIIISKVISSVISSTTQLQENMVYALAMRCLSTPDE